MTCAYEEISALVASAREKLTPDEFEATVRDGMNRWIAATWERDLEQQERIRDARNRIRELEIRLGWHTRAPEAVS